MAFIKVSGLEGLVYVPDNRESIHQKHKCPDCYFCQQCSEERCRICKPKTKNKENQACCRNEKNNNSLIAEE